MATYSTLKKKVVTAKHLSKKEKKNHEALCLHSATANFTPTAVQTCFYHLPFLIFVGI